MKPHMDNYTHFHLILYTIHLALGNVIQSYELKGIFAYFLETINVAHTKLN